MIKRQYIFSLITILLLSVLTKSRGAQIDTIQFNKLENTANHFLEYEYYNSLIINHLSKQKDISELLFLSYKNQGLWHTLAFKATNGSPQEISYFYVDSSNIICEYKGQSDSIFINRNGRALLLAENLFSVVRDTMDLYFNSFVNENYDKTLSVFFLPAFQPSGQAIYGCEWEYIFDNTGSSLIEIKNNNSKITGVWIGQPREIWLNYRNNESIPLGAVYFALAFRDYFTRLRIDTKFFTSTTQKNENGIYSWTHSSKTD